MARCIVGRGFAASLAALMLAVTLPVRAFAADEPRVFGMSREPLRQLRALARSGAGDNAVLKQVRSEAERALQQAPLSVTQKEVTPPSGDKHDYMSQAPYWWPDPAKPNGLPYIRRDGERNPELDRIPDHKNFDQVMASVRALAVAYYVFADEKYAAHASTLLRAWFLDPATRMNPNLQFAQGIPGINQGRGTGLIETRGIGKIVDGVGLLAGAKEWTAADQRGMEQWCATFLRWMRESANGKDEAAAKNNHGTYYDVQVASLALFTGERELARRVIADAAQKRIATQIEADGRQPLELVRTKSFSYSVMNLTGLFELARLHGVDVDLWKYRSPRGGSLRAALDYLVPFAAGARKWSDEQIEPIKPAELAPLLEEAAHHYGGAEYRALARKFDPQIEEKLAGFLVKQHAGVEKSADK
jgi:hypothetical protein